MSGKTALVTGANQGIGFGTSCQLASKGYNLVLACRSESNAKKAVQIIQEENPTIIVEYVLVDLASIKSVQECIRNLLEAGHQFDVIVLNAGVCRPNQARTSDNYEMTFQVNYLSQYLIAQHLINSQTHPIKIVTLNSTIYTFCDLIHIPKKSAKWLSMFNDVKNQLKAYALSKFAMALLAQSFSQQGIESVSVHPGVVPTSILTNSISKISRILVKKVLKNRFITLSEAAQNVVYCVENKIPENNYYHAGKTVLLSSNARNQRNIENLEKMNRQLMVLCGVM